MEIELSVVVPVYNEAVVLTELYRRLTESVGELTERYELLFVNDGSSDESLQVLHTLAASDRRVKYLDLSRNFGHQIAISAGLDFCGGNAVVVMDGDLQDPPDLIPDLFRKHKEGYDVVYARRRHRNGETLFKTWAAKAFYRVLCRITDIKIPLDTGDFRLIDRKVVDCLKRMPEQNKFLRGQIAWMGFRQAAVDFERAGRKYGKSGYSLGKMIHLAVDGITGFSNKPLEWVTRLGLTVSLLSLIVILYALCAHFFGGHTISGWTSTIVSSMFIGGVQLLSIGIIGTYLGRINKNIVDRPLYLVADTNISIGLK